MPVIGSPRSCAQRLRPLILLAPLCFAAQAMSGQAISTSLTATAETQVQLPDAPSTTLVAVAMPSGPQSSPGLQQHPQDTPPKQPSLDDLGLNPDQSRPDPDLQKRLDRRTEMLKIHQRLGIVTLIPLAAACISSAAAPPDPRNGSGNTVGRDIHLSLGAVSVLSYGATAFYAIRAPKINSDASKGGIKWHKYLIYVHAPGMVLTPILGAMAFQQANNGEKVHGIASAHAAVAWTTVAAYSTAILAVSWPLTHKS